MCRIVSNILVVILIAASFPDKVLSICVEDCGDSVSQIETKIFNIETQKNNSSQHEHDCKCPVHAHHCCNHVSLISNAHPSAANMKLSLAKISHFYIRSFISEPELDSLFRPPIILV